jgi:parvulin-like peptidyl-prolyl isomerase
MAQNKKFLAQREKEERQKRIIIIATIAVLVIVFGLIIYGVIDRFVLQPGVTIIELDNIRINATQFEQRVKWRRRDIINEVNYSLNTFQQLGGSPELFAYFEQQLINSITQLDQPLLIGQEVLRSLADEIILEYEARSLGIEITEEMIDREIEQAFGYYADGTPTPLPTAVIPEEDNSTEDESTPEATEQDLSQDDPDPTATPLLVPTEYTRELFEENYQQFLTTVTSDGITEATIRDLIKISLIQRELVDVITQDVDRNQEQVWIRHILVEDEETILEVVEKLESGDEFEDLAAEYSTDQGNKDSGGDLGWFSRGRMVEPFEEAAFALEPGEISEPVETSFGWHILESLGKEERPLDQASYDQLLSITFENWLVEKRDQHQPEINEQWVDYVPTEPSLPPDFLTYFQSLAPGQPPQPPLATPEE